MSENEKAPILEVKNLSKFFPLQTRFRMDPLSVKAVNNVSFSLMENETMSLVGETGCGKSTTGRTVMRLLEPTAGEVYYQGENIVGFKGKELKRLRREMQMVFQDPYSSLNPRMTIGKIIEEPLLIHGLCHSAQERRERCLDMMQKVGLRPDHYYRYPHEFSGGQKQRIGIARALILEPKIVVCDEPVSALDVSIQSQVLNLLREIKEQMHVTFIFISHNMSVVRYVSDRVGVMYLGTLVEEASTDELFSHPMHPYTIALLSAVPEADPSIQKERMKLGGDIPSPMNLPTGCVFHNRCPYATVYCYEVEPRRKEVRPGHFVRCAHAARLPEISQYLKGELG